MSRLWSFNRVSQLGILLIILKTMSLAGATVSWVARTTSSPVPVTEAPAPSAEQHEQGEDRVAQPQAIQSISPTQILQPTEINFDALKNLEASGSLDGPAAFVLKLAQHPRFRHFITFVMGPEFRQVSTQMWKHPQRKVVIWFQGAWVIFVMLMSAWWKARQPGMLKALGIRLVMTVVLMVGLWWLIPSFILGSVYQNWMKLLYRAFFEG